MAGRRIEMSVESVRVHVLSTSHVVILKELSSDRYLPIWIGPWEANAIATRLQGVRPDRPLTHDLLADAISTLGGHVREVLVVDLADDTFHARLVVEDGAGARHEIDARPSDAIAIAVRTGVRIWADEDVLARAGVRPESLEGRDAADDADLTPDEERLAIFRNFVNSLDAGDEPREGPHRP